MRFSDRVRVGILGGTFNPLHLGHLLLAQEAAEVFELSKVILIPCLSPPHKSAPVLAAAEHRLAMLRAAAESNLLLEVSDAEIRRGGVSYAVDTVGYIRDEHPGSELFFIAGADMLAELHQWRRVYELLEMCRFATFGRPGVDADALLEGGLRLRDPWPESLRRDFRKGRQVDISSSEVRYRVAEGMSIRYLVPVEVEMYIAEHGLYCG